MIVYRPHVTCESPEPDLTVIRSPVVPYYSAGEEHYKYMYIISYILYTFSVSIAVPSARTPSSWRARVLNDVYALLNTTDGLPEDTRDLRRLWLSGATWSKHARMVEGIEKTGIFAGRILYA